MVRRRSGAAVLVAGGGGGNVQSDADSGPVDTWGGAEPLTVRMQGGWHALASGLPQSYCD
jgi:hypothetical protein